MGEVSDTDPSESPIDGPQAVGRQFRPGIQIPVDANAAARQLHELLTRVAVDAAESVPGADWAGVMLLRADRGDHKVQDLAISAPIVHEIDAIQYDRLDEGPCLTAARDRVTVRSDSLGGDERWPRFGPRVGRLGAHSVLSIPLLAGSDVVGAINLYARNKNGFSDGAVEVGESLAAAAVGAVRTTQSIAEAQQLATQLQMAVDNRAVIDQAIGILRSRTGGSAEESFATLRALSQKENTKLRIVAERLVAEAVRRARARHQR